MAPESDDGLLVQTQGRIRILQLKIYVPKALGALNAP